MAALAVVLLAAGADRASAVPISNLYNTGVDNSNVDLAAGAIDPHYKLVASDDPSFPGPNALVTKPPLPGTWIGNSSTSQWISPNAQQAQPIGSEPPIGNAQGTYIYELTFDLTGLDPTLATISGNWAVDALGLIFLNGNYVPGTTNFVGPGALTHFTIPAGSTFLPHVNKLDFVVVNGPALSTGLRVDGLGGDAPGIPEPSTVVLAGIGAVGLLVTRLRRGRQR